jgi:hypothetical protein
MRRTRVYIFVVMVAAAAYLGLAVARLSSLGAPGWPQTFRLSDHLLLRTIDAFGVMLSGWFPGIWRISLVLGIAEATCLLTAVCMILPRAKPLIPRRTVPGECPTCGYDLIASIDAGKRDCPECGLVYDSKTVLSDQLDARRRRRFVQRVAHVAWAHWLLFVSSLIAIAQYHEPDILINITVVNELLAMPAGLLPNALPDFACWAALAGNSVLWGIVVAAIWDRWRHGRRRRKEPMHTRRRAI